MTGYSETIFLGRPFVSLRPRGYLNGYYQRPLTREYLEEQTWLIKWRGCSDQIFVIRNKNLCNLLLIFIFKKTFSLKYRLKLKSKFVVLKRESRLIISY